MKQITFFILFFFYTASSWAQEHCMFKPIHVDTELFPGYNGDLLAQDYLIIYASKIEFDEMEYTIEESKEYPFDNKDDLLRYFSCYHDFLSSSENIVGKLIEYKFNVDIPRIGNKIEFIYFNDAGEDQQFIYIQDGLYRFSNNPFFQDAHVIELVKTEEVELVVEYTYNIDTSAFVYYVEEPEFEVVTEQFLFKESYFILEEIPTEYEERFTLLYHEVSICDAAVYDTIYEQVLVKEGSYEFVITPAIFETVSEYRFIQNKFEGEFFYERMPQDSLSITLRSEYKEIEEVIVIPGCSEFDFLECINIDFKLTPRKDTMLFNVYENCAEGYESAGKYCYHKDGTVPWIFELREYEKLFTPAIANQKVIPPEYETILLVRIINKEELDSNCVDIVWDSIPFQKVLNPALLSEVQIPTEYETLQYNNYQDGGIIEVVGGAPSSNSQISTIQGGSLEYKETTSTVLLENRACYLEAIQLRLIEIGYLEENQIDDITAFHNAVTTFQIDNRLPIGVIDIKLVNVLDVNFGF